MKKLSTLTKKLCVRICKKNIRTSATVFILFFMTQHLSAQQMYGITIDDISNIAAQKTALSSHCKKMTTRVVFDGTSAASYYVNALQTIQPVSYIMGELLDSYELKNFTTAQYTARAQQYLASLGNLVDIWEIGNEVNGNWTGSYATVGADITAAYNVFNGAGKKTALTLYYNPNNCDGPTELTPLQFSNQHVSAAVRAGVDYVFLSYYETQCNNFRPSVSVLLAEFDSLKTLYPNAQLGFGEVGLPNKVKATTLAKATSIMKYYYSLSIPRSYYVGGYFWWYWTEDCVPQTKPLWITLDSLICPSITTSINQINLEQVKSDIYPNPFNTSFTLKISSDIIIKNALVQLYDVYGKLAKTISIESNEEIIDRGELQNGIYFYSIINNNQSIVKGKLIIQ